MYRKAGCHANGADIVKYSLIVSAATLNAASSALTDDDQELAFRTNQCGWDWT